LLKITTGVLFKTIGNIYKPVCCSSVFMHIMYMPGVSHNVAFSDIRFQSCDMLCRWIRTQYRWLQFTHDDKL